MVNWEARLYERVGAVRCLVRERRCVLKSSSTGICGNYSNIDGKLIHVGYGILSAVESRLIEIKPLFHYWPNSTVLTFSDYGCNFYCPWCQNHHLSFVYIGKRRDITIRKNNMPRMRKNPDRAPPIPRNLLQTRKIVGVHDANEKYR